MKLKSDRKQAADARKEQREEDQIIRDQAVREQQKLATRQDNWAAMHVNSYHNWTAAMSNQWNTQPVVLGPGMSKIFLGGPPHYMTRNAPAFHPPPMAHFQPMRSQMAPPGHPPHPAMVAQPHLWQQPPPPPGWQGNWPTGTVGIAAASGGAAGPGPVPMSHHQRPTPSAHASPRLDLTPPHQPPSKRNRPIPSEPTGQDRLPPAGATAQSSVQVPAPLQQHITPTSITERRTPAQESISDTFGGSAHKSAPTPTADASTETPLLGRKRPQAQSLPHPPPGAAAPEASAVRLGPAAPATAAAAAAPSTSTAPIGAARRVRQRSAEEVARELGEKKLPMHGMRVFSPQHSAPR